MKTTTIFEISKVLNLSPSTVSRALKNHPDISPKTRDKVLVAARKLDYEPNLFAVNLRKSNSTEIAIIVPALSGFFYESFISAVEAEAKILGYSLVILLSGDDADAEIQNLKTCKQRRVACIMICVTSKTSDNAIFNSIKSFDIPIIFFDKMPAIERAKFVCSDDRIAGKLAAQALLDKDKRIVLSIFGDQKFSITKDRMEAYLKVFSDAPGEHIVTSAFAANSLEAQQIAVDTFSSSSKTEAIFCMSDEILIGVMKAVQMLKLKVPSDVSIIAISNGFSPKLYSPEITYVETSGYKLGSLAMKSFMMQREKKDTDFDPMLKPILVNGGSL